MEPTKIPLAKGQTPLDLQANSSVSFEQVNAMATTRMVTRKDGSKVPYSEQTLIDYMNSKLEGLNK